MMTVQEAPPSCFGKFWDARVAECAGGVDPAFKDAEGSNVRKQCLYFNSCGAKLQASRMEPARSLLDPRSLVKQGTPVLGPRPPAQVQVQQPNQVASFVQKFAQAVQHQPYRQNQSPVLAPQGYAPTIQQQQHGQVLNYGYQPMMPVNYQMPGYLSVPEIKSPEESFLGFAFRTVLRSMGKSAGHSIAHLFDTVQLGPGGSPVSGVPSNGG